MILVLARQAVALDENTRLYRSAQEEIWRRKEAEEELRQSEMKYREFADSLPQIVYEVDAQGYFTFVNRSAYVSMGYTEEYLKKGLHMLQTFEPEDRDRVMRNAGRIMAGEKFEGQEYLAISKDGGTIPVVTHSRAVVRSGKVVGIRGVAVDISEIRRAQEEVRRLNAELEARVMERTAELFRANDALKVEIEERRRADEALVESEARFRRLAENAPDVIFHVDLMPEPRLIYISPAISKICRYSPEELLANQVLAKDLISPGDQPYDLAGIVPGKPLIRRWRTRDGDCIWTEQRRVPVYDRSGNLVAIEGIVRDITEWVEADEKVKASLKEKEVLLKEIHHRVKNNLQIINSLLRLQSRGLKDEGALEILRESQNRVRSMAMIHEKVYRSSDLARIDFGEYIRLLVPHLIRSYAAGRSIEIKLGADEILLGIDMAIPCGLIVNELVSNSLKHAFPKGCSGTISIELRRGDDCKASLSIIDDGIGLPEGMDFRNTHSMGLQLVVSLVEQIDGTIDLLPGPGTVFRISFDCPAA